MENTITKEKRIRVLQEHLLNDNSLLQFVREPLVDLELVHVRVRYIKQEENNYVMKDDYIGKIYFSRSMYGRKNGIHFLQDPLGNILEYNDQAVAFFKSNNEKLELTLYDSLKHEFVKKENYSELFGKERLVEKIVKGR